MDEIRPFNALSRQEFYDLVWSDPMIKLAKRYGISNVAIAKRCRNLNIPCPPRGYWAKLEAGQSPKRIPLPPFTEKFLIREDPIPAAKLPKLPTDSETLHPLATDYQKAIEKCKTDSDKRTHLRDPLFPETAITKALAPKAVKAFHVLITGMASQGIPFRRSRSSYDGAYFEKHHDRLYLKIEEELESVLYPSKPFLYPAAGDPGRLTGKLTFTLKTAVYGTKEVEQWSETPKASLENTLAKILRFMRSHYVKLRKLRAVQRVQQQKDREEREIQWRKHQEEQALRKAEEAKKDHAAALVKAARDREKDLVRAAEWWRHHRNIQDFIAECANRWRDAQNGILTSAQEDWLKWSEDVAKALSPFEVGYPHPSLDGTFNPETVPFGGPYPPVRDLPPPPTMPKIPAPIQVKQGYGESDPQPPSQRYPFWLKHP